MSNLWWLVIPTAVIVALYARQLHYQNIQTQMRIELIDDICVAEMYDIDAEYEALIDSES